MPTEVDLGAAELEVLKVLWDQGPSSVRDVLSQLHKRGRNVAYTTVLTFLTRLEQKGYVASDKSGVAYVYKARAPRERVVTKRVKAMVSQLFDGSAAPMALHLLQHEKFSPEELQELQRLIDDLAAKADRKRRRGGGKRR